MLIRRSILSIPVTDAQAVSSAWAHDADAIILDLQDGMDPSDLVSTRETLPAAIAQAGRGGADVFVRVNAQFAYADIEAAARPGLAGIVLPGVESPEDVLGADEGLTEFERRRGIPVGSLELTLSIDTAAGVWHVRDVIAASPRVKQVGIDEAALAASLGIVQNPALDPFVYARGRLCIEATAVGVQPVAVVDPTGLGGDDLGYEEKLQIATDARNLGFKGLLCERPHWIAAVNAAFTPTDSLVEYYAQVREVFAQALAAGTAAAPFAGRMIDVPVDERAKDVLALSTACSARDAAKQAALARAES
jgi:citrate lyase subunit beta/citryl-CoA lyase